MGGGKDKTILLAGGGIALILILLPIFARGPSVSGTITYR